MKVEIPCICGKHEKDTIVLRDKLDFPTATALRNVVAVMYAEEPDSDLADVMAVLTEGYILRGIESWSLRGADNKPLPPSRANIRAHLLSNLEVASDVGEVATDLYQKVVMLPLVERASKSSPPTPTTGSTSQKTSSSTKPPKRSRPSSIVSIPTADTEATSSSLDGDSSISQKTVTAA